MSRKKTVLAVAAMLAGAGAIAAVSAPGPRGWMGHGGQHGRHQMQDGHEGMGRRGWLAREVTKDDHDTRTRERFARLDKNSDGFIDAGEIEAAGSERRGRMMERFRGGRGGDGAAAGMGEGMRLVQRFDTNRDGKATKDEFLAHVRKRFAERDLNNDGKISDDDLPPMMRGQNAIQRMASGQHGGRMGGRGGMGGGMGGFGDVEVKDGAITLDAALAAATRQFDRFDRNKDGAVDKADMDALRKDMTDYHVKRFIHANGADKEGKVSREQFFAKSAERFAEHDLNGDGKIGRGEMGDRGMGGHGGDHGGGRRGMGGDGPMQGGEGRPGPGAPKQ